MRDDEDVVHRQRLLDGEAGQVFHAALLAKLPPDPAAEGQAKADVAGREHRLSVTSISRLSWWSTPRSNASRAKTIDEGEPHPGGLAEPIGATKNDSTRDPVLANDAMPTSRAHLRTPEEPGW